MPDSRWLQQQSQRTLDRLLPRLEGRFAAFRKTNPEDWGKFIRRVDDHFERLFTILLHLYGDRYDFFYHLEALLMAITQFWVNRSSDLKTLDLEREAHPDWYQTHQMLGGVCYVDFFAGNLAGIREKIPYFKELGLTFLHLMPLFKVPEGENDVGGFEHLGQYLC
jgi:hypothetical protein